MKAGLVVLLAIFAIAYAAPKVPEGKDGMFCGMCVQIVTMVEKYINDDEPDEEQLIDKYICDSLRDTFSTMCRSLVHEFLPVMIQYLNDGMKPPQVCDEIGLCNN